MIDFEELNLYKKLYALHGKTVREYYEKYSSYKILFKYRHLILLVVFIGCVLLNRGGVLLDRFAWEDGGWLFGMIAFVGFALANVGTVFLLLAMGFSLFNPLKSECRILEVDCLLRDRFIACLKKEDVGVARRLLSSLDLGLRQRENRLARGFKWLYPVVIGYGVAVFLGIFVFYLLGEMTADGLQWAGVVVFFGIVFLMIMIAMIQVAVRNQLAKATSLREHLRAVLRDSF